MMKLCAIFCGWLLVMPANAQVDSAAFRSDLKALSASTHFSSSRQFIIHDPVYTGATPIVLEKSTPGQDKRPEGLGGTTTLDEILAARAVSRYARLEASALTVSCERIKLALLRELDMPDQWQGKIFLDLHQARSLDETILVMPTVYGRNWEYHIALPDVLERSRVVSAMVEVLLLEMANRNSGRSAEIPAWLTQGLTQELMLSSDTELVLEKPEQSAASGNVFKVKSRLNVDWRRANPLAMAHDELGASPPLTLEELSWPKEGQLEGKEGEVYRSSAQLFIHELLQFKDGHECLRAMVRELAQHLNWQISLRDAFKSHFASQLDLEKWWALKLVEFTGRDLTQTWPGGESRRKLEEIIHPTVEVRTGTTDLPLRTEVSLQTIIKEWDFPRQAGVLRERSRQLSLLRARVSQDLIHLVDDYRRALETYLKERDKAGYSVTGKRSSRGPDRIAQEALRELDVLDIRREQLREKPELDKTAATNASISR
ncbi:MAG TPA: hypothetical protein VFC07_11920 [Verrucomicrobiae bacterium]|nr:hypothetical protein [Verrucomicrobiae bacterium]